VENRKKWKYLFHQATNKPTNKQTKQPPFRKSDYWEFPSPLWPFLRTKRVAGCDINITGVVDRAHANGFHVLASDINVVILMKICSGAKGQNFEFCLFGI